MAPTLSMDPALMVLLAISIQVLRLIPAQDACPRQSSHSYRLSIWGGMSLWENGLQPLKMIIKLFTNDRSGSGYSLLLSSPTSRPRQLSAGYKLKRYSWTQAVVALRLCISNSSPSVDSSLSLGREPKNTHPCFLNRLCLLCWECLVSLCRYLP